MSAQIKQNKKTLSSIQKMKHEGEKIACLTAYDASFAEVLDKQGVDIILVGDSLGMVIQGKETTIPVTVDEMIYHGKAVNKTTKNALLMMDMPFMSTATLDLALANATKVMQQTGAQIIKLEGVSHQLKIVEALTESGVPVCAHLGLQPQSVHKLGGYKVQGRTDNQAKDMLKSALALQQAGADMLLLECVPASLAKQITQAVNIPVIGIGAGVDTDGQILVLYDLIGISTGTVPKFSKNFLAANQGKAEGKGSIQNAVLDYISQVKNKTFPTAKHSFN